MNDDIDQNVVFQDNKNAELPRYRLREVLGRGGIAEVYRAYDEAAEMDVAIKVLHDFLADDEGDDRGIRAGGVSYEERRPSGRRPDLRDNRG